MDEKFAIVKTGVEVANIIYNNSKDIISNCTRYGVVRRCEINKLKLDLKYAIEFYEEDLKHKKLEKQIANQEKLYCQCMDSIYRFMDKYGNEDLMGGKARIFENMLNHYTEDLMDKIRKYSNS